MTPFSLISRDIFIAAPPGAAVMATSYYVRPDGGELRSLYTQLTRSDTNDIAFRGYSSDNGHTWSVPTPCPTREEREGGTLRRFFYPAFVEPATGLLVSVYMEGLLPNDDPLKDGVRQWYVRYAVSADGGATNVVDEQVIQQGAEFSAAHPLPGHWVGKNAGQVPAPACAPLVLPDGTMLAPCQMSLLDENDEYYNPGGGHSYHEALVLRGRWQDGHRIAWQASARVECDATQTTRGLIEPTLALLNDGRILMVLRGSNDVRPELPATKWFAISEDGGATWGAGHRWTYENGETFFSPSSCSQLLRHSSGKLLWLGNISPQNPQGNAPRYPLVIGEVNRDSGLLIRVSVSIIDGCGDGDSPRLQLSNFFAREDRESGDIVVHCTRLFAHQETDAPLDWTADALEYRIAVHT